MKIIIQAKTKSKLEKIEKIKGNEFKVWVKEPPVKGRANEAICKILAGYFNASPSHVKIISGALSKHKIVEIK